ncbi:MAG: biotin-dependent carboxyltransferase [Deltaproteobacteria bacterium]|nr:biotin-dependent carboxyltransferase [Deltaproteobacteria bacterium]
MSHHALLVRKPGLLTSVQDLGREGYQNVGIPPSGAMDSFALRLGNLLLKNPIGEAALEMTALGGVFEVCQELAIAFTGGDMSAKLNEEPLPRWEVVLVKPGDVLSFGRAKKGCRGYLCIAGGIDVPVVLGSKATYMMGRLGGYRGRALRQGDRLRTGKLQANLDEIVGRKLKPEVIPPDKLEKEIRVVLGPQDNYLAPEGIDDFFAATWRVSPKADRMGYRFEGGPEVKWADHAYTDIGGPNPDNIIDDGIPLGGIQLPGGIEPIVLLVDGPSAGGFVKVGCVIRPDIDVLGQAKTGDPVRFKAVSPEEAANILRAKLALVNETNVISPS